MFDASTNHFSKSSFLTCSILAGTWYRFGCGTEVCTISETNSLTWKQSGRISRLITLKKNKVLLRMNNGAHFSGYFEPPNKLNWSDGDVWVREKRRAGPNREFRVVTRKRSNSFPSFDFREGFSALEDHSNSRQPISSNAKPYQKDPTMLQIRDSSPINKRYVGYTNKISPLSKPEPPRARDGMVSPRLLTFDFPETESPSDSGTCSFFDDIEDSPRDSSLNSSKENVDTLPVLAFPNKHQRRYSLVDESVLQQRFNKRNKLLPRFPTLELSNNLTHLLEDNTLNQLAAYNPLPVRIRPKPRHNRVKSSFSTLLTEFDKPSHFKESSRKKPQSTKPKKPHSTKPYSSTFFANKNQSNRDSSINKHQNNRDPSKYKNQFLFDNFQNKSTTNRDFENLSSTSSQRKNLTPENESKPFSDFHFLEEKEKLLQPKRQHHAQKNSVVTPSLFSTKKRYKPKQKKKEMEDSEYSSSKFQSYNTSTRSKFSSTSTSSRSTLFNERSADILDRRGIQSAKRVMSPHENLRSSEKTVSSAKRGIYSPSGLEKHVGKYNGHAGRYNGNTSRVSTPSQERYRVSTPSQERYRVSTPSQERYRKNRSPFRRHVKDIDMLKSDNVFAESETTQNISYNHSFQERRNVKNNSEENTRQSRWHEFESGGGILPFTTSSTPERRSKKFATNRSISRPRRKHTPSPNRAKLDKRRFNYSPSRSKLGNRGTYTPSPSRAIKKEDRSTLPEKLPRSRRYVGSEEKPEQEFEKLNGLYVQMKAFRRANPSFEDAHECLLPLLNEIAEIVLNAKSYPVFSITDLKKIIQPHFESNPKVANIIAEFSSICRKSKENSHCESTLLPCWTGREDKGAILLFPNQFWFSVTKYPHRTTEFLISHGSWKRGQDEIYFTSGEYLFFQFNETMSLYKSLDLLEQFQVQQNSQPNVSGKNLQITISMDEFTQQNFGNIVQIFENKLHSSHRRRPQILSPMEDSVNSLSIEEEERLKMGKDFLLDQEILSINTRKNQYSSHQNFDKPDFVPISFQQEFQRSPSSSSSTSYCSLSPMKTLMSEPVKTVVIQN